MNFVFRWSFRFPKRFVFGIYQSFNWMPSKDKYLRKNMSLHFAEVSIYISFSANVAPIALWHQLFFITVTALISFRQRRQKHEHIGSVTNIIRIGLSSENWSQIQRPARQNKEYTLGIAHIEPTHFPIPNHYDDKVK